MVLHPLGFWPGYLPGSVRHGLWVGLGHGLGWASNFWILTGSGRAWAESSNQFTHFFFTQLN